MNTLGAPVSKKLSIVGIKLVIRNDRLESVQGFTCGEMLMLLEVKIIWKHETYSEDNLYNPYTQLLRVDLNYWRWPKGKKFPQILWCEKIYFGNGFPPFSNLLDKIYKSIDENGRY